MPTYMHRAACFAALMLYAVLCGAVDLNRQVDFAISAQKLDVALMEFSRQAKVQVIASTEQLRNLSTGGVTGNLTISSALKKLLANSGLVFKTVGESAISIGKSGELAVGAASATTSAAEAGDGAGQLRLVQSAQNPASSDNSSRNRSEDSGSREKIQEIIVTATKREERVQDVPISMAVIGPQEIERRGLVGMEDYLRSIPGVNEIDRGVVDNAIVVRGITSAPQAENFSSGATVATYFGETPITGAGGYIVGGVDVRPVDLERIEVLRGPQGTSFGSASLSGALRLIPKSPDLDRFSAKAAATYSYTGGHGGGNNMIQGVANIPLVEDKFGIRLVGYRYYDSGAYRNIVGLDPATLTIADRWGVGDVARGFTQDGVGDMESTGGRISVLWKPTDNLSATLHVLTQEVAQNGYPFATLGEYEQAEFPVASQRRVDGSPEEYRESNIDIYNLVLNYDLPWAVVTATASRTDSGVSPLLATGLTPFPFTQATYMDVESSVAEIRLASRLGGRVQFLGGLFYEDTHNPNIQYLDWPGVSATNPLPTLRLPATDPLARIDTVRKVIQRAVFGEISYDLSNKLMATLGGRYFDYDRTEYRLQEGGYLNVLYGAGVPSNLRIDESDQIFKANLTYRSTDQSLLYASWSQGFRLGRPTTGVNPVLCDNDGDGLIDGTRVTIASTDEIGSDYLDSYEVGAKLALFDRRVIVDAAVYYQEWNDVPVQVRLSGITPQCTSTTFTANVGGATSRGVEFQSSTLIVDGFRVDFGAGYVKAELSKDVPTLNAPAGSRLPGAPRVNANLGLQYDFKVAGRDAFVRADSVYAGEFYGDLLETPGLKAGGYLKVDARTGIMLGRLSAELFVRNVTDRNDFTWRGPSGGANPFFGYRLRPRTIGLQLGYVFQ